MATTPNKLSQFWQELKRRKVTRVITVYAAAAFIILQLVEILAPSLRLPEWTMNFILVLLIVGFIIAVIVSWIYDVSPEGGIVKTEPAHLAEKVNAPKSSNGWKIASYVSFVMIIGLIVLNVIPRLGKKMILEKSVAVLPFFNDSDEEENTHFLSGIMEELIIDLQSIKELRVPSRNSVEKYRSSTRPSTSEIAHDLGVNYIVEGSGQKYGNRFVFRVQLIEGSSDAHLWGNSYNRQIEHVEDIVNIHSEIAKAIAEELQAVITPEENQLLEKVPTNSLMAHNLYQKGHEEYLNYVFGKDTLKVLQNAETLYRAAMIYDSTYANVYLGLAKTYWEKHYEKSYFQESFLDSALVLIDKALHFDNRLAEAYTFKGSYYLAKGLSDEALEEYNKALYLNQNDYMAYWGLADFYKDYDFVVSLENYAQAISLHRGPQLPQLIHEVGILLFCAGFIDESIAYYRKAFDMSHDSVRFFIEMTDLLQSHGEFEKAAEYSKMAYAIDSLNIVNLDLLGSILLRLDRKEEALKYYEKWNNRRSVTGELALYQVFRLALAYWENGQFNRAEYFFDQQIESIHKERSLGRWHDELLYSYFDQAAIQAFTGEKEKALENLRIFKEKQQIAFYILASIENEPFFNDVKNDLEFKAFFQEIEAKYQAGHERVRQWLEENDIL